MSNNFRDAEVLLEVQNLKQYFGSMRANVKAVDDVSFQIHKGEVLGVVGESGCGKTTTGRSIIKLYDITGGKVIFNGETITVGIPELKMKLKEAKKDRVFITHSGCDEVVIASVQSYLEELQIFDEILITRAGGVISSHCGPNTLGVLFIRK